MKKKRKRKKSSARRASDSSEEESDAESKVQPFLNSRLLLCLCEQNQVLVLNTCSQSSYSDFKIFKMPVPNLNDVFLPKKKKKRMKEEGDKDKVTCSCV